MRWFTPGHVLRMATGSIGELLSLPVPRRPWAGPAGAIEPGALADLRLVDGDRLADIERLEDPARRRRPWDGCGAAGFRAGHPFKLRIDQSATMV